MTRSPRGAWGRRLAATVLVLLAAGCGLPGDTEVRTVDDDAVPYRLLERDQASAADTDEGPVPGAAPVVFWLREDDRLAPTAVTASCDDRPDEVATRLLRVLEGAPDEGSRSVGRSTASPPSSRRDLVGIEDGVVEVALDPATSITADRLPLAVGQLVLTLTSAAGIDAVRVSIAGDPVQVPLPGGALTSRPVSADDYAALLPDRYLEPGGPPALSSGIGCREPGSAD